MRVNYNTCDCCGCVIDDYDHSFVKLKKKRRYQPFRYLKMFSTNTYYSDNNSIDICEGCWSKFMDIVKKEVEE